MYCWFEEEQVIESASPAVMKDAVGEKQKLTFKSFFVSAKQAMFGLFLEKKMI